MTGPLEVGAGRILGPYRLIARLGAGGMGEVYKAEDMERGRILAVKILPAIFVESRDRVARFEREARIASSLRHPNIAAVYEVGEADGVHFIAMEYVEGRSLSSWLEAETPPLAAILRVMEHVGEALARAHESGVLHRDLKPANVIVTRDGHAKLLDFGLAKVSGESGTDPDAATQEHLTRTGVVMGTMAYMSPEQAKGHQTDRRSDIFSFGILVYEAVAGIHPFPSAGGLEAATGVLRDDPIPMLRRQGVAHDVVRVVAKALEKEPARRYQYMDDVVVDLREVRRALESGEVSEPAVRRPLRWWLGLAIGVGAGLALAAGKAVSTRAAPERLLPVAQPGVRLRPLTFGGALCLAPSISPDGKRVAYASDRFASFDILLQDVATGRVLRLTEDPGDELRPAFSPDGQTLAFATTDGRIRTIPALGGTPRTLVEGGAEDPVWSPDGSRVAYRTGRRLFVVSRTGGDSLAVTGPQDPPVLQRAAWSPEGRWLVFPSLQHGRYAFARVPSGGGEVSAVGDEKRALGMPTWGGGGTWIVGEVAPPRDPSPEIWAMPVGRSIERLGTPTRLFGGVFQHQRPSLSSDGRRLVFEALHQKMFLASLPLRKAASVLDPERLEVDGRVAGVAAHGSARFLAVTSDRGGLLRLWKLPREGGALEPLREGAGGDEHPAWSPDARRIALSHIDHQDGSRRIALMSSTGGELTYVSEPQFAAFDPAWSPDGREIAFAVSDVEWSVRAGSAEGGPSRLVATGRGRARKPTWSPDGRWIATAVRAPDGRWSLLVLPARGGVPRQVLDDVVCPLWLRDGRIVFAREEPRGNFDIWSVAVSPQGVPTEPEKAMTRLPRSLTVEHDGGLSSDGSFLYFMLVERASSEIWLAEAP